MFPHIRQDFKQCKFFFSLYFFVRTLASGVNVPAAVQQEKDDMLLSVGKTSSQQLGITISYTSILSVTPALSMEKKNASTL